MKDLARSRAERRIINRVEGYSARTRNRVKLHDYPLPMPYEKTNLHDCKISRMEQNFVHHYTTHYHAMRAAQEAGYPPARAHNLARNLLNRHDIKQHIAKTEQDRLMRLQVKGDYLLNRILQIALADPNELVELRVPPCRYCYGKNHLYQRTHAEMEDALEAYSRGWTKLPDGSKRKRRPGDPPFDEMGGDGYDTDLAPNPSCPECRGRGLANEPVVHFKDSRYLSPDGRALYAGARIKRGSVEVMSRDQDAAWSFLARFAERWLEQREAPVAPFNPEEMTTEELDQVLDTARELGYLPEDATLIDGE